MSIAGLVIRDERSDDRRAVATVIEAAFAGRSYASGTEARIHEALRGAGAATVALVAEEGDGIVGQAVVSPMIRFPADQFGTTRSGHQWKPAWPLTR
ncbi:MAG TPA: hypothetical protein VM899_01440, partial [Rubellimicrobium sp.]|nr:hypothetical protein [Rubellimicrobium sp.]